MNWTGTRPLSSYAGTGTNQTGTPVVTLQQMIDQLRISETAEYSYICDLIDAATEYAESSLDCSLLTRTITANYFESATPFNYLTTRCDAGKLYLPRGPIVAIASIVDATGQALTNYQLGGSGNADWIQLQQGFKPPVVVTYTAGYGATLLSVPADIRLAIRTHVASLWRVRESISEDRLMPVPHSLEAFYALKRRSSPGA